MCIENDTEMLREIYQKDLIYDNMPYTPEELLTLKEIRIKNKQRYQKWYYENKTKVKRKNTFDKLNSLCVLSPKKYIVESDGYNGGEF